MRWLKKPPEAGAGAPGPEHVAPVALAVGLDERIFAQKLAVLMEALAAGGGLDVHLAALERKSEYVSGLLSAEAIGGLTGEQIEGLVQIVMPARRRVGPLLAQWGEEAAREAISALFYGRQPLDKRLAAFVDAVPVDPADDAKTAKKRRRAVHDFAAELLHFRDPRRYPLMCRWVWDQATHSGAVRELVKGGDTLNAVPLGSEPGVYEAARQWVVAQLAAQGVYREPHFVVDLFLAHAYADYMRAMSSGMGLLNADFGGSSDPLEMVKKLLGVDEARPQGLRAQQAP